MKLALVGCVLALGVVGCGSTLDVGNGNNGNGGGGTTPLDGTWDITAAGQAGSAGSQLTVKGNSVTGHVIIGQEGREMYSVCTVTLDRTEFLFTVNGDVLSGSATRTEEFSGKNCPSPYHVTGSVAGTRTQARPKNPGDPTNLNGEWQVSGGGESWLASLNGASATGSRAGGKPATMTLTVSDTIITLSSSDDSISFAARRR